jgi:hypothetical protein
MRMLVTVEFADAGAMTGVHKVLMVGGCSDSTTPGDIGMSLEEAKALLSAIQWEFIAAQAAEIIEQSRVCQACGSRLSIKDWKRRSVHTLFGHVLLQSPRLISCPCSGERSWATTPLKGWLARTSQELRYQAARLGSGHSYRQAAAILHELLGVDVRFGYVGVRQAVLEAGSRLDREPTIAHDPDLPPRYGEPPPSLTLAFDGGYARRTRKGPQRNFEILTGACEKGGKIKVFATAFKGPRSLRRRLARFIDRVGHDVTRPTALMTDGAESLLRLKKLLPIPTRSVLDYFHVAMKVRHADQCIGRIPPHRFSPDGSLFELYDRFNYLRGYLWSGRHAKFKESLDRLLCLLDRVREELSDYERSASMAFGHLCELDAYLKKNESGVINYGEWRRAGRRISTGAVEGTVNRLIGRRMCKAQHMCWSRRGAHLLLQVRCAVFNGDFLAGARRWFPSIGTRHIMLPWDWLPHRS